MRAHLGALLCLLTIACFAQGQAKMFKADFDGHTLNIVVFFDAPAPADARLKNSWQVYLVGTPVQVLVSDVVANDPSSVQLVFDDIDKAWVAKTNNIIVVYKSKQTYAIDKNQDSAAKPLFSAAKDKKTAEVYMNLGYSPAIGSPQQYSIDTALALLLPVSSKSNYGHIGGFATVNTDKRKVVDPDSFRVFLAYQRALAAPSETQIQGILFTWLASGAEFDHKANNLNYISSPILEFPTRLFPKSYGDSKQPIAILVPVVGAEVGDNVTNAVTNNGLGALFRGLAGADFSFHFNPKLPGFQGIQISSTYRVRIPSTAEVFTNTTTNSKGQTVDVPSLSTKARNYVKSELDFVLVKSVSFSITHEHGELPPAFRVIGNKVTIGLTYSLAVNRGVSDSLRNK